MLWFIGLALAGVLGVTWWVGSYPARIVVINEGSLVRAIKVITSKHQFAVGDLRSGETRIVSVPSGDYVTIEFDASQHRRWQSPDKLAPAQSLTIIIRKNERVLFTSSVGRTRP